MNEGKWKLPSWMLQAVNEAPSNRSIALLLRHSVRDALPPGDAGNSVPITQAGSKLAHKLGALWGERLSTLHTSPVLRCVQTAEALAAGAGRPSTISANRLLGDPGVFVLDAKRAWSNWERLGHEGVMHHLINEDSALVGMAAPDKAARLLVQSILDSAGEIPGIHVFVTHDSLVAVTAARIAGKPFGVEEWPCFLEGALFWREEGLVHMVYREHRVSFSAPSVDLAAVDAL